MPDTQDLDVEREHRLEEIGAAAAGVAHDINNQLTLILNHLSANDLRAARTAANRCADLTAGLLSLCRGDQPEMKPLNTADIVHTFLRHVTLPFGVQAFVEVSHPATIMVDPVGLSRALYNLVENACAAMEDNGILRFSIVGPTIEIHDSGPGIPPDLIPRVFEPFFSTKGERGTGLGLAIVRDVMRRHGGSATVKSKPGEGASFCLRFRAAQS